MIEFLFIIFFALLALFLGCGMALGYTFFNNLEANYKEYYSSIGRPRIIGNYAVPTADQYVRALKGSAFSYALVFKGVPRNFPSDSKLRKMAQAIRIVFSVVLVLFVVVAVLMFMDYRSSM